MCSQACGTGDGLAPHCVESIGALLVAVALHFVVVVDHSSTSIPRLCLKAETLFPPDLLHAL